jgi:hypothetical protein
LRPEGSVNLVERGDLSYFGLGDRTAVAHFEPDFDEANMAGLIKQGIASEVNQSA